MTNQTERNTRFLPAVAATLISSFLLPRSSLSLTEMFVVRGGGREGGGVFTESCGSFSAC